METTTPTNDTNTPILLRDADLVIVELRRGEAGDANSALCLDLEAGSNTRYEWRALVQRTLVANLLAETSALLINIETWDGSDFGDGNGGTVKATMETGWCVEGDGLNRKAYESLGSISFELRTDEGVSTLVDEEFTGFVKDNQFDDETVTTMLALEVGEKHAGGGGAQPSWTLRRTDVT